MKRTRVFVDGSAQLDVNAGIGVYFQDPKYHEYNLSQEFTIGRPTNSRAELYATHEAILYAGSIEDIDAIELWTDSDYVYNIFREGGWFNGWRERQFRKANSNKPIENKDLIRRIDEVIRSSGVDVEFHHIKEHGIKSHSREPFDKTSKKHMIWYGNKCADKLANDGRTRNI